jgi:hypothetical protein
VQKWCAYEILDFRFWILDCQRAEKTFGRCSFGAREVITGRRMVQKVQFLGSLVKRGKIF